MPSDTVINIGIIGSGFIARTHAFSFARGVARVRLIGIAGGTRAGALADEFSVRCFPTPEAMITAPDIDAVVIATPHQHHAQYALKAAHHGKHVLIEKPMASSVRECLSIIEAYAAARRVLMVAFTQRFRRTNREAFHLLRTVDFGKILMVQEQALIPNGASAYPSWQQSPDNLGILFGYGVHNIDRMRWLLNDEPTDIIGHIHRNSNGIESSAMASLRWSKGTLSTLWSSIDLPSPGIPGTAFRSVIVAEKGILDIDGYGALRMSLHGGPWETICVQPPIDWRGDGMFLPARMESFNGQNQSFIDSIIGDTPPPVSGSDGLRAVAIALDVYRSSDLHASVVHKPME